MSYLSYVRARSRLRKAQSSRYIAERIQRKSDLRIFEQDLEILPDNTHWLCETESLKKCRVTCAQLDSITDLIAGYSGFKRGKRGPKQMPVKYQLMVCLHFIGHESTGPTP